MAVGTKFPLENVLGAFHIGRVSEHQYSALFHKAVKFLSGSRNFGVSGIPVDLQPRQRAGRKIKMAGVIAQIFHYLVNTVKKKVIVDQS